MLSGAIKRRWIHRTLDRIVPTENPARVVYGIVAVAAVLAAESGTHENYLDTIVSALIALGIYWLTHAYASVLGRRLAVPGRLTWGLLWRSLKHEWAIVEGAAIPLVALLFAWFTGAAQATAVNVALWSAVASLIAFELAAAIRSDAAPRELVLEVGVGIAMASGIIALKIVLHH